MASLYITFLFYNYCSMMAYGMFGEPIFFFFFYSTQFFQKSPFFLHSNLFNPTQIYSTKFIKLYLNFKKQKMEGSPATSYPFSRWLQAIFGVTQPLLGVVQNPPPPKKKKIFQFFFKELKYIFLFTFNFTFFKYIHLLKYFF
jgi:hypothetical protein